MMKDLGDQAVSPFMRIAVDEARASIARGDGGPFASVVVRDGDVIAVGCNRVVRDCDPTAHGEITALRAAGARLGTFDLSGCELYTTGEPCHMCLTACLWANIDRVWYGCSIADNSRIGFRDGRFDDLFGGRDKLGGYLTEIDREACLALFDEYAALSGRIPY